MHTIQTHKGELIVVEVELESKYFSVFENELQYYLESDTGFTPTDKEITEGCEIVGTCTNGELDFDCEPYVKAMMPDAGEMYYDYMDDEFYCDLSALDSFLSLLTSHKVEYANTKLVFLKREK